MNWARPVTPLHALVFVGVCACGGFAVGAGMAMLATSVAWRRVRDALGW